MGNLITGYYAIADVLGFPLEQSNTGLITGDDRFRIPFGALKLPLHPQVLSNIVTKGERATCLLLIRVKGNLLALFEARSSTSLKVHFLNATHLTDASGWLERHKPESVEQCLELLKPALVRSFESPKSRDQPWVQIT